MRYLEQLIEDTKPCLLHDTPEFKYIIRSCFNLRLQYIVDVTMYNTPFLDMEAIEMQAYEYWIKKFRGRIFKNINEVIAFCISI